MSFTAIALTLNAKYGSVVATSTAPEIPDNTGALWFDGVDQYGSSAFDPSTVGTGDISAEIWFKPSDIANGEYKYLFSLGTIGGNYLAFYVDNGTNYSVVYRKAGSGSAVSVAAVSTYPDKEWHQVILIRTGTTIKVYIDGVEEYNLSNASYDMDLDNQCLVGSDSALGQYWKGNLDNFRVWAADVSDAISYLWNDGVPVDVSKDWVSESYTYSASLKVDNRMEELTGTTVADGSGESNTLTLNNSPVWHQDTPNFSLPDYAATHAVQTDGSTDFIYPFINLKESIDNGDFTIHCKCATSDKTQNGWAFLFGGPTSNLVGVRNASSNSRWIAGIHGSGGTWQFIENDTDTVNDQFYDIVITRDYSTQTFKLFIDGVSKGSVSNTNCDDPINPGAILGAYRTPSNFFVGDIRTLSIWDEVLTDTEIAALTTLGDHDHRVDSGNYASQANLLNFLVAISKTGTMLDLKGEGHGIFQSSPSYVSYP